MLLRFCFRCSHLDKISEMEASIQLSECFTLGAYVLSNPQPVDERRKVFSCLHRSSNSVYTALQCPASDSAKLKAEVDTLLRVSSPHVAQIMDLPRTRNNLYIICERVESNSLRDLVNLQQQLSLSTVKRILWETLSALAELHRVGLIHGSVSPDSLFLTKDQHVKISGLRCLQPAVAGSYYQSAEVLRGGVATAASDLYATACVAAFLATGKDPYSPRHCQTHRSLKELIRNLMDGSVTAEEALKSHFFRETETSI